MAYDEYLARRMRNQLIDVLGMVEKKMFGGIGFLIHGNMACGVNGSDLIVRLSPEQYDAAIAKPYVKVFDMTGRPMRGWVVVTSKGYEAEQDLRDWIQLGVTFARSLPAK